VAYIGENTVEHMIPLEDPTAVHRIQGFFTDIGWIVLSSESGLMLNAVPATSDCPVEGIGYWRTARDYRMDWFEDHSDPDEPAVLSEYTRGVRLPRIMDLIERPLVVPTDDDLLQIIENGGDLLKRHTHVLPRFHAERLEFRFSDPFLLGIRITGPRKAR
jgi:hypothetical protein